MIGRAEVERVLGEPRTPTERRLHFAALLAEAGGASPDQFIVVGGSAIEIYASGRYTSGDIDIVSTAPARWPAILRSWGFKKEGRVWYSSAFGIAVDFVKPPYTYDVARTQVLVTPYGTIRLAAIEDLLVKRLISAKFWKVPEGVEHAKLLALAHPERIDWDYVQELALRFDVADVLARLLEALS